MSKKQIKQFIIIIVALVVCVVGYFAVDNYNKEKKEKDSKNISETNMTVVFEMESVDDVTGFAYVVDGETIMLLKDSEGNWLNSSDEAADIDESTIEATMLSNIVYVESSEVIESPEDLSAYGLDKPSNQIVISMSDGTNHTLMIGAQNAFDTNMYYMMLEGDSNVYVIDSVIPNAFNTTIEELVVEETTVAETVAAENSNVE